MPSKNMIQKGKRRQTVKHDYRVHRDAVRDAEAARKAEEEAAIYGETFAVEVGRPAPEGDQVLSSAEAIPVLEEFESEDGVRSFVADAAARGKRLDAYLAKALPEMSRARVQLLIENGQVRVDDKLAKAGLKLEGGERVEIKGEPQPPALRAEPEDIPLKIVYEDADLAVIDKPAGMTVHAGAGDAEHNRGTLVNALLFHFQGQLSGEGGALRPGIVHRLDKETSGLILVAKNDLAHRKLAETFQNRALRKAYVALVHGVVAKDEGTINLPIGRDLVRRTRMTTKRSVESGARTAVSHWRVLERIGSKEKPGKLGIFSLVEVEIETGRTHQIRVHLAALGHPVVGDTLYGAPGKLRAGQAEPEPTLDRNFLHAKELDLPHPRTGKALQLRTELPRELVAFLDRVRGE
jgi:23S rRNA pseudouridine1911/1915/1917 synthase